ncbi:hypothetical protein [Pseudomonas aeruginosa]|uniref:hypothetical protein n=1 Tax=Pseudomonas aeruginosa TaxID=287 RepID=UPI00155EB509|nr:hypothetical protein [Pseudomonas aeruginosa]NRC34050.1 hypothetical protein [Pseudomonas aeruginosa]
MPTDEMTRLIDQLRKRPRRELSPCVRLYLAAYDGRGLSLTAEEVARLSHDGALWTRAVNELEALGLDAETAGRLVGIC